MAALTCTPNALQAANPCLQAYSETSLLAVIALALCKINGGSADATCTANSLMEDAKCFLWTSDKQKLQSLATLILNWAIDEGLITSLDSARDDIACLATRSQSDLYAIITKLICEGISSGTLITPIV